MRSPVPFGAGDWLFCDTPALLDEAVRLLGPAPPPRKRRLLACAVAARAIQGPEDRQLRRAVEAGVALADGRCDERTRKKVADELVQLPAERSEIPDWLAVAWLCVSEPGSAIPTGGRTVPADVVADCYREVFPTPFAPVRVSAGWQTPAVLRLAVRIAAERVFDQLPQLANALEGAGCDDDRILDHCRKSGWHAVGCWVLDLILDKS